MLKIFKKKEIINPYRVKLTDDMVRERIRTLGYCQMVITRYDFHKKDGIATVGGLQDLKDCALDIYNLLEEYQEILEDYQSVKRYN